MYQTFVLVMAAQDLIGAEVQTSRVIHGDDKDLQETAALLCRLAIMDGMRDVHVVGVYTEVGANVDSQSTH